MEHGNISVVICAYSNERWNDLIDAVTSVDNQTVAPREIVVVIDHNPDLLQRAQTYFGAHIVVCENTEEPGLSGGRNTGIAASTGGIVAFLDDDAIADSDWIEALERCFRDPTVFAAGGTIEPIWNSERPGSFPREFDWVVGCTYLGMPTEPAPVRNLIGCNMAFRREAFTIAGGFRSGIGRVRNNPVGCEETELCIRVRQARPDVTLLFDPAVRVKHRVPSSRGSWEYFRSRCYAEGISKAQVTTFVGANDALSDERKHVFRTLPAGVIRGIADTLFRADLGGIARSSMIVAGLVITASGYAVGSVTSRIARISLNAPIDPTPGEVLTNESASE